MIAREPSAAAARFREVIDRPDEEIDLAEAALLIAKGVYPDLDIGHYLAQIDRLAQGLSERLPQTSTDAERMLALNRYLFEEHGFAPNLENYYDVRNSFLNDVLERRLGIPITLSILYIEVGCRIGLSLQGVSFPGHFLVKCQVGDDAVILDPYSGGVTLSVQDLQQRLRAARAGDVSRAIIAGMLVPAKKKEILARVLRNLKAIYLEQRDRDRALAAMEWIVSIAPDDPSSVRERGLLNLELECFRAALQDLERYLILAPEAGDVDEIRHHVVELRKTVSRLN